MKKGTAMVGPSGRAKRAGRTSWGTRLVWENHVGPDWVWENQLGDQTELGEPAG